MYLKSLTLRGFKSFADKTELVFEPGVTVIVGPNGSGKSNVVDALSWVLGSHSPKSLRGASMADVIFAGAPGRSGFGRAAVSITIDNSDGALPLEFSEVTLSRAMFATGENEYAINGEACRLLDVQELLSDTGLGRENHSVIGQGQLDAVLNAKPDERRAFIEEAAGILKHRRRKDRALRKLAQMEGHLERLGDVLTELRRNLRPLERQAEAAAKQRELTEQLTEVRRSRAVREYAAHTARWEQERDARGALEQQLGELQGQLADQRRTETELDEAVAALAPAAREAAENHFRIANLSERLRGLADRIEERRAGLVDAVEEPVAGRDPAQLRAEAASQRSTLETADAEVAEAQGVLAAAEERHREAEQARRAHEQAAAAEARRRAEARERLLRWEGEITALRSSLAQAASEEGRLASQLSGQRSRREELAGAVDEVQAEIQRLDAQGARLAEQLSGAEQEVERAQQAADTAAREERELERERASLEARADALRASSEEATEGASALLEAAEAGEVEGVLGPLADHLEVVDGFGPAVAAALGPLGDALVVRRPEVAEQAVGLVRSQRSGRVLVLAGGQPPRPSSAEADEARELADIGVRPLAEFVGADELVWAALAQALSGVYVVGREEPAEAAWALACRLARRHPPRAFVTVAGEIAGPQGYAGGSAGAASAVQARAAAEQAEKRLAEVSDELLRARRRVGDADRALETARSDLEAASAAMQECDGQLTGAAERLKRLRNELETCDRELEGLQRQHDDLAKEIAEQRERLAALEARGADPVEEEPDGPDPEAERLEDALAQAREQEVQARLDASSVGQRRDELARRIEALEQEADDVERQLAEREQRRQRRLAAIRRCGELAEIAALALGRADAAREQAAAERDRLEEERAARQSELGAVRAAIRELEESISGLRESHHAEDLRRQELETAIERVAAQLRDELEVDPDAALRQAQEAGEDGPLAGDEGRDAELAEQEDRLVRKLGLLGTVNPLAVKEYEELKERHEFLTGQIEDLQASRRDLLEVVEAVDARIRELFAEAFADVDAQFRRMFPRLFPGGEGRLVLTEPDDLLATGVDVEARPAGKRVRRLSLLSGGERSLTALAVLFAIFAARPSPFYVLDEVEAALDDVNLQRFLDVVSEFCQTSQLLIVTHQRRTMEAAERLYGITMRGDGVSKVVSQRLEEAEALLPG